MRIKTALILFVVLLAVNFLVVSIITQTVRASGTIYIRPDGSVDPATAPIQRDGNLYTFTADIYDSIRIQKPDVVINGGGFKLQGAGAGNGFSTDLAGRLKILNTVITGFQYGINTADCTLIKNNLITGNSVGIYAYGSALSIANNVITDNGVGISLGQSISVPAINVNISNNILTNNDRALNLRAQRCIFSNNTITKNHQGIFGYYLANNKIIDSNLSDNTDYALMLWSSQNNIISGNTIEYNNVGLNLTVVAADPQSTGNAVTDNVFAYNNVGVWMGFRMEVVRDNWFYHNNFIDNVQQVYSPVVNYWDNGYPSGGNFWTDYIGDDVYHGPYQNITGSDGIGDTPYIIDENDRDNYPFITPYPPADYFSLRITTTAGGTTDPTPALYFYAPNTPVSVTALPGNEYILDYWSLDNLNVGSANPISVTMDMNHVLQAVFKLKPVFALTITATTGGTTNPSPGSHTYAPGAVAVVSAIPQVEYLFDYWELDGVNVGSTNPISVTMDTDHSLHAVFVYVPSTPEFPGVDISIVAATFAFLAASYSIVKGKKRNAKARG